MTTLARGASADVHEFALVQAHGRVLAAQSQRLRAAAQVMLLSPPRHRSEPAADVAVQLGALIDDLLGKPSRDRVWLVLTALAGGFPAPEEVLTAYRALRAGHRDRAWITLLDVAHGRAADTGSPELEMDVRPGQVLVDVDFCATSDLHTGIQRVVRETVPRWTSGHDLVLVGWSRFDGAYRGLSSRETHRVLRWGHAHEPEVSARSTPSRLVVPWRSRVIVPENPEPARCPQLSALARFSGNTVTVIGYDCIPVVSPELIHPGLPQRFVDWLAALKHVDTIAGISVSAAREFEGFAGMVRSQGLRGPRVTTCSLPVQVPVDRPVTQHRERPMVFAVGSFEPRKNQVAVLHAAERLWREGLDFDLQFVGGGGYPTEFDRLMQRLTEAGRTVSRRTAISDAELWAIYAEARFTVFASLHEGYGLPVAESLALGTPALATSFGSTAEIAEGGGVMLVDPRDDEALVDAMRRLLIDDVLVGELRDAAVARPRRTWDDYASELWSQLGEDREVGAR